MDLGDLGDDLTKAAAFLPEEASQIVRSMALVALDNIVLATPKDLGGAQANWFVSIDSPSTEVTENIDGEANKAVQSKIIQNAPTNFSSIFISNNLPYIARLNDGYSDQAPKGFIEKAVIAAEKNVEKAKNKFMRKL